MLERLEEPLLKALLTITSVLAIGMLAVAVGGMVTVIAVADTAGGTSVSLGPIFEQAIMAAGAVALAVGSWALNWVRAFAKAKTGVELEVVNKFQRETLEGWINKGVASMVQRTNNADWTNINVRSTSIAGVLTMLIDFAPKTLKAFGFDPTSADARAKLRDYIESKLPEIDVVKTSTNKPGAVPETFADAGASAVTGS